MTKCAILLFCATIAGSFYGSLAESPGSQTKLENIEKQLRTLRMGQDRTERQLEALLQKLSRISMALTKTGNLSKFEQIGSSFFYIESIDRMDWSTPRSTCAHLGGHLASIPNEEELSQITRKLPGGDYWLDINDLDNEGEYRSATTNRPAPFLKWGRNYPSDSNGTQDCVYLSNGDMKDGFCHFKTCFICETEI